MTKTIKKGNDYEPNILKTYLSNLIFEGFHTKFSYPLFTVDETLTVINSLSTYIAYKKSKSIIICEIDKKICGFIFFSTSQDKFTQLYSFFRKTLSIRQTFKLLFILYLLTYKPEKNEKYIEMLVVSKHYYRNGVARSLLFHCIKNNNYQNIVLNVASDNYKAVQLYENLNFKVIKKQKSLLTNFFNGKKEWLLLRRTNEKN